MSLFPSPTSATGGKVIATNAFRSAGLIDRDATMRDVGDNPGGRKGKVRKRITRFVELEKDGLSSRPHSLRSSNSHAGPSDPLSFRGGARPTMTGRMRRNNLSGSGTTSTSSGPLRISKPKGVDSWREFVQKRWNPEAKYLNLDSMIDDETVKKYSLLPPGHGGTARDAAVIFKLASQLKPEVQTLSLANNNLTGSLLAQLSKYLPNIVHLSLQNNKIRDKKEIGNIFPRKEIMIHLKELVLTGNPIYEQAMKAGDGAGYRATIARRLPSLEVLDQEAITQIAFDAPELSTSNMPVEKPNSMSFPVEMQSSLVNGVPGEVIGSFLFQYLKLFDTQRDALLNVYDPAATFSFSVNTSIPSRARVVGFHSSREMPNQRKLEWGSWLDNGSRNLNRIGGDPKKTIGNLHVGSQQIVNFLKGLPQTMHDIAGPGEKFCLDAFPVNRGTNTTLLVMVHGEFKETASGGVRSFDRTFTLKAADEGSLAKLNGWQVSILSDQWTIRSYSSHEAWKPGPLLVQAVSPQSQQQSQPIQPSPALNAQQSFQSLNLPPDQQAAFASLPEWQRDLVSQICAQTRLNVKYSIDCLNGNGWDLAKAVANFNQVKASLTNDAFLLNF